MQSIDLEKFTAEITPKIAERLSAHQQFQIKCYLERREWQLQQFNIGWDKDWSQTELIAALNKRRKTLRKMAKRSPHSTALILRPMVEAAYLAEVKIAQEKAA